MQLVAVAQLLVLLAIANGTPILAKKLLDGRFAHPLDGGLRLADRRPLFGASKTIRGLLMSLLGTTAAAPLVGLDAATGTLVAATAMAGDLFSSFVKRRLALPPSSRAVGLDQIPESLFPLLACRTALALTWVDIAVVLALFFVGEQVLSRLLYLAHVRDQPY